MRVLLIVATLFGIALHASHADAQTWSAARARPALWQISSVDASGEPIWPYGREDIAGDGLGTFEIDEAGADLRTLYADADTDSLWLRAYVAGTDVPPEELIAFFFLDLDDRNNTGGDAQGAPLFSEWKSDPSAGGYERAIGVRGDGTLIGAFSWSNSGFMPLTTMANDVRIEVGVDRDPIRIGNLQHGYVQVALSRASFGLNAGCDNNIFVRLWHDDKPKRSFGDDDDEQAACLAPADPFGDPIVLRADGCGSDAECPAAGECVDGVCVFGYECSGPADCRSDDTCSSGVCVRTPGDACTRDDDCDGLVCADGECAACAETGARACEGDGVCAPNGTCLAPGDAPSNTPGLVRGGAFECAAHPPGMGGHAPTWLLLAAAGLCAVRRRRRQS